MGKASDWGAWQRNRDVHEALAPALKGAAMASLVNGLGGSAGFGENSMPLNDDSPSIPIDLTSLFGLTGLNFFGTTYTGLYLNYNGSISFGSGITSFSPTTISGNTSVPIIAPFWADVDIRNTKDPHPGTNQIWWDLDVANKTFTATWDNVGYFNQHNDKTNDFQLRLVGKDTPGDFDIFFIYESIDWLTGDASGGTGGTGGSMARAGYSSGNGKNFKEIAESGTAAMANLESLGNAGAGIFLYEVRNGVVPLFTSAGDTVDFNNLTDEQKASIAAGNDVYVAKGGSDTVTLPNPANYNQVVGKDKDNNDITLDWDDRSTFDTQSRAGDTSTIRAGNGRHVIQTGAGTDIVLIDGAGDNKIMTGNGHALITIVSTAGNNTIEAGDGELDVSIATTGAGNNKIAASFGDTTIEVDSTNATGLNEITTGSGDAEIDILQGNATNKITAMNRGKLDIEITSTGSGNNEITTGTGATTIKIDSTTGTGSNAIKIGTGETKIDIVQGQGVNHIVHDAGLLDGKLEIKIELADRTGSNSIDLKGNTAVSILGKPTVINTGSQVINVIDGFSTITFDGNFTDATVTGSSSELDNPLIMGLTLKNFRTTLEIEAKAHIADLRMETDSIVKVADGGSLTITHVHNVGTGSLDGGRIDVGANATLLLVNEFYGTVNLGTGSSTLVLDRPGEFGFARTANSRALEFKLGNIKTGDKIILEGSLSENITVTSATLGNFTLADGIVQLTLELGDLTQIAVGSIDGETDAAGVYFDVSKDGANTVLTLKDGNNVDATMQGPQVRAAHDLTGSGLKIGIIGTSFASDRAGASRDWLNGTIPTVHPQHDTAGPGDDGRALAAVLHSMAPDAELYFYGIADSDDLRAGINALRDSKVDIIVASGIVYSPFSYFLSRLDPTISAAVRAGITVLTGAGNSRPASSIQGIGAHPDVITVAAMNLLATPTETARGGHYLPAETRSYSSVGTNGKPDVTGVDGGQTTFPLAFASNPMLNTLEAAASVAGVVALMMDANPLLKTQPKVVARILEATALQFGAASDAGAGFVNTKQAIAAALAQRQNFLDASTNKISGASLAVPDGLSAAATAAQPVSAALSVPVGNAGTGLTVMMLVEMGQAVTVSGSPTFSLNTGGTFTYDAALSSPSQGRLVFNYTVAAAEQTSLLSVTAFNGTIKDSSGADADFSNLIGKATGLTINSPLIVTAVTSSHTGQVTAGQALELTITLHHGASLVSAGGLPSLTLNVGAIATFDAAKSNLAAGQLVFDYVIAPGEATPSLTIASIDLPNGSTIKDVDGNNADFALALDQNMGVQIGPAFVAAVLPEVEMTAVGAGQTVEVMIALSQGVVVDLSKGSPTLTLGNGATATYDAAASDPTKGLLIFDYKVAAGDQAATNLLVTKVALNGATIRDAGGSDVDLGGAANAPTGLTIGSPLTVASTAASRTGVLNLGETVTITLTMSGGLQAFQANGGSFSTFTLSDGGKAVFDAAASDAAAGKLVFDYTVAGSDQSVGNLAISQFNQNGGVYFDDKGNFADFSGALGVALGLQVVVPDPATATIAATSATKAEGNSGTTAFTFTVTLSKALGSAVAMDWAVTGSDTNSVSATDFAGGGPMPGGTLSFAAGETAKTITVNVQGDTTVEADENFTVTLSHATGSVVLGTASAGGTIQNDEATVSIAATSASKAEGNSGSTVYTFTVTRGGNTSATQSVAWSVAGVSADPANAADFTGSILPSGSVTFAAGETTKTISINVLGDTTGESSEAFAVTLANASAGLTITTASAGGTIQNDDTSVSIAATDATKAEGNAGTTAFTFTLTRSGDTSGTQSVAWSVAGSGTSPANTTDFVGGILPAGSVTFATGETAKVITINVQGDTTGEGNEGFTVTLASPSAGLTLGTTSAAGTIQNDDTAVSIAAASASKAEGNSGSTAFTFTLTRSGDSGTAQSVSWSVAGFGATPANAADFAGGTLPSGNVTFAVGETVKTVTVNVQGDTQGESNEDFTVTLANASAGLAIGTASATGTIQDDDTSVSIAATSASKAEGNSGSTAFTFTVTRSGSTSAIQSVAWSVAGSGANPAAASDFAGSALPTGSVTFGVGETSKIVTVNIQGDTTSEPNESFAVTLANASAGLIIATATATGTIQNDDAGPLTVHDDAYVVLRGSTIVVSAANGVLFNDEGSGLTASLKTAPSVGGLQLAADGSFTYTPLFGFAGVVTFAYHATSAGNSADGDAVLFVVPTVASPSATTLDLLALTSEQQIAATYAAFFGRAADAGGFGFWVGEFNRLLPVQGPAALFANIASSFGISPEAKALYPFLANPFGATDAQISAFLDSVYNNLFNRSSDTGGLGYWTGEIRNALANGQFVGSVLVNIMSGAQDTAAGKDISTLMGKVAVSIDYVHEQQDHNTQWAGVSDIIAATNLLHAVAATPQSILTGIKTAETLIANHS